MRGDRQRLHAVGIAGPAGHVDFGRADRGGDPAMHVALEVADGLLPRREVAERDVHMRIDQPRNRGRAVGVDHDVAGFDVAAGAAPTVTIRSPSVMIVSPLGKGRQIAGDDRCRC